ncbi:hypothetical protein H5410_042594 [Solanum commersonii]|uniref:Uncharacterized protein n=1 Tax=Solanum commersonii TaxID=4109 RepID=A0A9J5XXY2_SOLCO|nr:hypothetical protein H5410_042594 [Solanum commersonii]
MTVPIALRRNSLYDDMIASIIEADELTCKPNDLVINNQINGRGKIHPIFIKNDRHVSLYMPLIEPTNSFNGDNDSIENERLGDHSKESLDDNSDESLGDH